MILPDVNLLLYAYDFESEFHPAAARWLNQILATEEVFFSWHTVTGFLRIVTNPRASLYPLTLEQALGIVTLWLDLDNTHLINLEKKNWPIFAVMLREGQAAGNLVMDAHLAALATSCGARLATTDRDFSRFSDIRTVNPLK